MTFRLFALGFAFITAACSAAATPAEPPTVDVPATTSGGGATDTPASTTAPSAAATSTTTTAAPTTPAVDTLDGNRARLLGNYIEFLKANATTPQSNGLSAATATTACTAWSGLAPSAQLVFLTLTARLQGSKLASDGSSMLSHITKIYRIAGGEDATAADPGSCGGGEYNRMIMSMDPALHAALIAANATEGNISDLVTGSFWRDSHDLGGPHAPFDLSDETDNGAPRGQTQFFTDPTSTLANTALGRQDLETLVDPLAIEMDQDYDCAHHSNPACSYTFYGPLCLPQASKLALDIYTDSYGSPEADWQPTCQ